MHLVSLFLLLASPFWESKKPREWSDEQLLTLLTESPWAQTTTFRDANPLPLYLASAKPMRAAETEWLRRYSNQTQQKPPGEDSSHRQYLDFLAANDGKVVVIAVRNPNFNALAQNEEIKLMEEESFMKVGRKKTKMTGHFPPGESDPVLRLVFPRPTEAVKDITFDLYIPGITAPYRTATFKLKDLIFEGKTEM